MGSYDWITDNGCEMRISGHQSKSNLVRVVGAVELEGVESLAEGLAYTPHTLCYAGAWGNLICVNRPA